MHEDHVLNGFDDTGPPRQAPSLVEVSGLATADELNASPPQRSSLTFLILPVPRVRQPRIVAEATGRATVFVCCFRASNGRLADG